MSGPVTQLARRALRTVAALAALSVLGVASGLAGCASEPAAPAELPLAVIEPSVRLELVASPPGPARIIWGKLLIEPSDSRPLTVAPAGPAGDGPGPRAIVELRVRWEDHRGDGPVSVGHTGQSVLEWAGSQVARLGQPAVIAVRLELSEPLGALARRVDVDGRLIGIELRRDDARSGGVVLNLPPAHLDSLAPLPVGPLEVQLQTGSPGGIFLTAAGSPPQDRQAVLDRLIDALPASEGPTREAILAALLYLTGETHGRDAQLWRTWWNEQRQQAHP